MGGNCLKMKSHNIMILSSMSTYNNKWQCIGMSSRNLKRIMDQLTKPRTYTNLTSSKHIWLPNLQKIPSGTTSTCPPISGSKWRLSCRKRLFRLRTTQKRCLRRWRRTSSTKKIRTSSKIWSNDLKFWPPACKNYFKLSNTYGIMWSR